MRPYSLFSVVSLSWCEVAGGGFRFSACGLTYFWKGREIVFLAIAGKLCAVCVCVCMHVFVCACMCLCVHACVCVFQ